MADNTTTYKAVIDVETKGIDNFNKLNAELDESLEGFEDLGAVIEKTRKALQKAALEGDKTEFKRLRKELNQMERQFEEVEITSRRFSDALAEQPGVVGLVGQSIKGLDGGLKVLAANPIIAVVTLLAGLFISFRESLQKTERGQALLNKASEAFGKILGPVFATIEKVAFPIFEFFIEILDKAAAGFQKFARFLGVGQKEIDEASRASSEVLQQKYEENLAAEEEATKKLEEEAQKRIEAEKKEAEERKRIAEEAAKAREDALKIQDQARLALMDEMDRELLLKEREYQANLKQLRDSGVDTAEVEAVYQQDVLDIKKKYDDEKLRLEEERLAKEKELKDKAHEEEKQRQAEIAQKESDQRMMAIDGMMADYDLKVAMNEATFQDELRLFDETMNLQRQELVAQGAANEQLIAFDKVAAAQRIQIERAQQMAKLDIISGALGAAAQLAGENTKLGKALSIAEATINTLKGVTLALASAPPPFNFISAAAVAANGFLQVRKILQTKVPEVSASASGGSGPGGSGGSINFTQPSQPTTSFSAPQIQTLPQNANSGAQIAESIASATQKPIKAYVVSKDISDKQALDRRVNDSATL